MPLTMLAQVNLTTAGLDKSKVYTLQTARGGWYADTQFKSTGTAGATVSTTDINQQFAFVPSPIDTTVVYLYSVGQKKFVKKDASLLESSGDPIYIWQTGDATHPLFFSFTNNKDNYNINIGGANQITIDTWKTYDAGNKVLATEVANADYDLAEAQDLLQRFSIGNATQGYQTTGMGNDTWLIRTVAVGKVTGDTKIEKLYVTLKDSTAKLIDEVRLYTAKVESANDSSNFYLYNNLKPIATAAPAEKVELTPNNLIIPSGESRYIWLNVKVKDTTAFGATVDASIDSIATADTLLATNFDPAGEAKIFKTQHLIFPWWSFGTKIYRIPALIQANNGTLIAVADDRRFHGADAGSGPDDLVLRLSYDNGRTWGDRKVLAKASGSKTEGVYSFGDPAIGKTKSGKIIVLTCATSKGFFSGQQSPYIFTSDDNGENWDNGRTINTPQTFTDKVKNTKGTGVFSFFCTSGRFITTHTGRLMVACPVIPETNGGLAGCQNNILYSDDEGATWTLDNGIIWASGGNETKLVQRKDHSILASVRQNPRRGFNVATSDGMRWMGQTTASTLPDPGVDEDIIAYGDSTMLIHTSNTAGRRANLRIFTSHDQGTTWTDRLTIQTGDAAYSTMEVLDNGDLAIFYEDGCQGHSYDMNFVVIPKETIMQWQNSETPTSTDYSKFIQSKFGSFFSDSAPTTGYFTLDSETRNSLQPLYNKYSEHCDVDGYFAMQDLMRAANFNFPPTGYYRLRNAMQGTDNYGWLNTTNGNLNNTQTSTGPETVVKLTLNPDTTYSIAIQGQYIQTPSRSKQVARGSNATSFTPSITKPGRVALFGNAREAYSALHMGKNQGYIIVGWEEGADASQWIVEDAETITIPAQSIGNKSFSTLYVPFATEPVSAKAATITIDGDSMHLLREKEFTTIPQSTPVLLYADGAANSFTLNISDDDSNAVSSVLTGSFTTQSVTNNDLLLGASNNIAGFYKNLSTNIAANRAYIRSANAGSIARLPIDIDTPTGINSAINDSTSNGSTAIYNLWGQPVNANYKGIIIKDGKKQLTK